VIMKSDEKAKSLRKTWLGLVFLASLVACTGVGKEPATVRPSVAAVTPADEQQDVPVTAAITAAVTLPNGVLDMTSLTGTTVYLKAQQSGAFIPAILSISGRTLKLQPKALLETATTYVFTVTSGLRDSTGASFPPHISTFTTTGLGLPLDSLRIETTQSVFPNRVVLHRIQDTNGNLCDPESSPSCNPDATPWAELKTRDTATLELSNTGTVPLELRVSLTNPDVFRLTGGARTLTLMPGTSDKLVVQFIKDTGDKSVYETKLQLKSTDGQTASVDLVGIFMNKPEGSRETPLADLVRAFGYTTDLGANNEGTFTSSPPDAPLAGDEVRSVLWERVDANRPVTVRQLAAFHSCCVEADDFSIFLNGGTFASFKHDQHYAQTIFPLLEGGTQVAGMNAEPNTPFEIRIAGGFSTDPTKGIVTGDLSVRLWPARDQSGRLIPDTFLVTFDHTSKMPPNYDFQDDLYLLTNVRPAVGTR